MTIHEMSIDLETYSDVDIKKSGVYKYAESDNFEILLFGVSIDGAPVVVYDLACVDTLPEDIINALVDDTVIKWAFNAVFERVCLSYWLNRNYPEKFKSYGPEYDTTGNYLNPVSWRCTMIWSAYMGLPLSLEGVGAVLGLKEQKMKEGKNLIRYFCVPCKPTKANGGRTRNLHCHAPDKWTTFKSYNERDVVTEMGIKEKLHKFPVPDFIWDEYHLDQQINDRGILVDMQLVKNAIAFDERSKSDICDCCADKGCLYTGISRSTKRISNTYKRGISCFPMFISSRRVNSIPPLSSPNIIALSGLLTIFPLSYSVVLLLYKQISTFFLTVGIVILKACILSPFVFFQCKAFTCDSISACPTAFLFHVKVLSSPDNQ